MTDDDNEAIDWLNKHVIIDKEVPEDVIFAYDPSRMWAEYDTKLIHQDGGVLVRTTGKIVIKK